MNVNNVIAPNRGINHAASRAAVKKTTPRRAPVAVSATTPSPGTPSQPSPTNRVEHRVVDVVVLGESTVAAAAAYSLSKAGKKVVLIRDMGLKAGSPGAEVLRAMHIPAETLPLAHLNNEASAYWRGIQSLVSRPVDPLVMPFATADLGVISGPHSDRTQALLAQMEDMCNQSGIKIGSIRGGDIEAVFPCIQSITGEHRALLQPYGAVLHKPNVDEFLLNMAERNRCLVRSNLAVTGWRDAGDHFSISAASRLQPDLVSVFETEQVLLAPDGWVAEQLNLFGLSLGGVELLEHTYSYCGAGPDLAKANAIPLLRYWGGLEPDSALCFASGPVIASPSIAGSEAGEAVSSSSRSSGGTGGTGDSSATLDGAPGFNYAFQSFPLLQGSRRMKIGAAQGAGRRLQGIGHAWAWSPGPDQSGIKMRHRRTASFYRDLGPLEQDMRTSLALSTTDGLPILGFHPGFEVGRMAIACTSSSGGSILRPRKPAGDVATPKPASGSGTAPRSLLITSSDASRPMPENWAPVVTSEKGGASIGPFSKEEMEFVGSSGDGYQLSPVLARFAADLISGVPIQDINPEMIALTRDGVDVVDVPRTLSTWDGGLKLLQDGSFYTKKSRVAVEEEAWLKEQFRRSSEE